MELDVIIEWLSSDSGYNVHASLLTLLLLGGVGFPIPEDIPVFLAGIAAGKGIVRFEAIFITAFLGVILSDMIVFCAGFFFGNWILEKGKQSRFLPALNEDKLAEVKEGLRKNRLLYIFIGRHLYPVRSVTFLAAGALRVPIWEFLIADAAAAVVSVNVALWLGYLLAETFSDEGLSSASNQIHLYMLAAIVVLLVLFFSGKWYRRRYLKKRETCESNEQSNSSQL